MNLLDSLVAFRLGRARRRAVAAVTRLHRLAGKSSTVIIATDALTFEAGGSWSMRMENSHEGLVPVELTPMPYVPGDRPSDII